MCLDVSLVTHVQPKLVAELIPAPVVGIVTVPYGVEVEPVAQERRKGGGYLSDIIRFIRQNGKWDGRIR